MPYIQNRNIQKSFFPSMTLFWNNLEKNIKRLEKMPLKMHLTKHKPKCNPYYYLGNRQFNIIMARLRMRCSELRQHLFDMNIIENKNCECGLPETTSHFFSNAHCTLCQGVFHVISFCVINMNLLFMFFYMASVMV